MKLYRALLLLVLLLPTPALAQQTAPPVNLQPLLEGIGATSTDTIIQSVLLLTLLSVLPGLAVMMTSFTRLIIAFSFLRSSLGLQSTPANIILITLALFLTMFIMAPTFDKSWNEGLQPLLNKQINEAEAYGKIVEPFKDFMLRNVREKELAFFQDLAAESSIGGAATERDLRILVPSFMVSELRRGFEIGFLIALPFLIIDLVVATVTMSMGMMMLPPTVISLPFKVLFFVLIDGWTLLAGSLVRSFS